VLCRADGVHVGQEELTIRDVRQIVGPEMLVGVSTHSIEQARQAVLDGASYLGCGPTFPSETKHFDHFPGLDFLRQVAAEISLPAFAIGGITLEHRRFGAGFSAWPWQAVDDRQRRARGLVLDRASRMSLELGIGE
jgi:thiamine-phosphate pyrophosphorylase